MTRIARMLCAAAAIALSAEPGAAQDSGSAAAAALHDFAYSIELRPNEQRAVHSVLLPIEVYRGVASAELADVRVFNAAFAQVPHAIRTLDAQREVELGEQPLALFPLHARLDGAAPLDALALHVKRDASGTVIDIRPPPQAVQDAADAGAARPIVAYILDASAIEHPITGLRVAFAAGGGDYVLPVTVEASEDLGSFQIVAAEQPLVSLAYGGERVERHRLLLPAVTARYLRLRWSEHELPAKIAAVHAELGTAHAEGERHSMRVRGRAREGEPGVYDFDLGGVVPVDRVRVVLPQDNSLVEAELDSRAQTDGEAQIAYRGLLYRVLHEGERIESPQLALPRRSHRYWQLRVEQKGGGFGSGVPELEVSYHPDQLLFVARGEPPFHLAYGHHGAAASSFGAHEILALLPEAQRAKLPRSDSSAGPQSARAGPAALIAPPPPPPIKRYVLWAVLIAGTLGLGFAALRVSRSLR